MKITHLIIFSLLLIFISCEDVENAEQTQPIAEISPETLDNSETTIRTTIKESFSSDISWKSYRDRDIIKILFEEAIEKNKDLRLLVEQMEVAQNSKSDTLNSTKNYLSNNELFYNQVDEYLENIKDSVLEERMSLLFDREEKQFQKQVKNLKKSKDLIHQKSILLNQQLVLMKIFIANSMMKNYQKESLPDTKSLEDLIENYDILIEETKEYIE